MSENFITLRDHSQPCEHWEPLGLDPNRWAYLGDGGWACDWGGCPGGRERTFFRGAFLSDEFPVEIEAWVEVTDG